MEPEDPMVVAVALSLYAYNVDPEERAIRLYQHFEGQCASLQNLIDVLTERGAYAATELAPPTAEVFVLHALQRYGEEARRRVRINRIPPEELLKELERRPEE